MSRTIEPGVSLLTACEIRVVVLPIGPMPRDTFDAYLDVFNAHRHVPLNAARSFYQGGPKSPFSHLPYKTGAMHFRFMQADEARRRSRTVDLHQQRQIVAVLGLLHCPLVEDLMAAHSEFGRASKQWPEALVARCCAFDPSDAHLSQPGCKGLSDLMIIPGGHIHQHLEVYMQEFTAAVLAAIEDHVLNASVSSVKMNTYVDSGDFLGSMVQIEDGLRNKLNINEEELHQKKRWGRFQKLKGDWALLAGSPRDAFEHYKSAMELSRAAADAIWYGAAVEGVANARVLETLVASRAAVTLTAAAAAAPAAAVVPTADTQAVFSSSSVQQQQSFDQSTKPDACAPAEPVLIETSAAEAAASDATPAAAAAAGQQTTDGDASPSSHKPPAEPSAAATSPTKMPATSTSSSAFAGSSAFKHGSSGSSNTSSSSSKGIFTLTSTELDISPSIAAAAFSACAGVPEDVEAEAAAAEEEKIAAAAAAAGGGGGVSVDDSSSSSSKVAMADTVVTESQHGDQGPQAVTAPDLPPAAAAAAAAVEEVEQSLPPVAPQTPVRSSSSSSSKPPTSTPSKSSHITAAAAAAGSSAATHSCPGYSLSGPAVWSVLSQADIEGEIRELLAEARNWYKRKGGALALQIEQVLKLCRFAAGLHGAAAVRSEVTEAVSFILDNIALLTLPEDKMIALNEAGQILGLAGCGRKRLLLLWAALDMFRTASGSSSSSSSTTTGDKPATTTIAAAAAAPGDAAAMMRLALRSLMPPDQPRQQDADDLPRVHWSMLRFIAWQQHYISQQQSVAAGSISSSSSSKAAAAAGLTASGSSGHRRRRSITNAPAAAAAATSSNGQQQQQFYQILGPQLQLLAPDQAAVLLQRLMICDDVTVPGSNPAECTGKSNFSEPPGGGDVSSSSSCIGDWPCLWDSVLVAVLESVVNVSKVANAPLEAWEAAATLLRECYVMLPQSVQVLLMETCAAAGSSLGSRARLRPGPGPGPQVYMKRILQGAPCLQPLHLTPAEVSSSSSSSGGGSILRRSETGPFIFNPYAAKKKGASAAAAAEQALPEWVCNAECYVEVLLVNPCAAPLKLDNIQLVVQQLTQQQQQDRASSSSSSGSVAQCRGASVSLAAGSKPVRVVLGYTPTKPGLTAITGIQASCWGVSWYQPFVHLPRVAAAAAGAGYEAVTPQGVFTVAVQPPLPLIKAVLHGPEVQLVQPSEDELAAAVAAPATSSSSASSASATWPGPSGSSSSSTAAAAAASDLDKKLPTVFVHEGQSLSWTLNLTNISDTPVTGCKVTVLNAKGVVIKPIADITNSNAHSLQAAAAAVTHPQQQQQQLPASFSGAHMVVQESPVSADIPLLPGKSVSLPVLVTIGGPPGDAFDAVTLQVQVTYCGAAQSVTAAAAATSSSSGEAQLLGRRLTIPLKLAIQPTLQVTGIRFLQHLLPYINGVPAVQDKQNSPNKHSKLQQQQQQQSVRDAFTPKTSSAAAAAGFGSPKAASSSGYNTTGGLLRRQQSRHNRNSSEGAVPVMTAGVNVNDMLQIPNDSHTHQSMSLSNHQQQQQCNAVTAAAAASSPKAAADRGSSSNASGSSNGSCSIGALSVRSEPVLELTVRNASERYFRAWLGCAPDQLSAESALSAVVVLEPGDSQRLTALLPPTAAVTAGSSSPTKSTKPNAQQYCNSSSSSSGLCDPCRLQVSEGLVTRVVICWEMITGAAGVSGQLPRGRVQLAAVDVAANMSQNAVCALCPSPLSLRLTANPAAAAAGDGAGHGQLVDLIALAMQHFGVSPIISGLHGPLWGMHLKVGQWLALDLEVAYAATHLELIGSSSSSNSSGQHSPLVLQVSLSVTDLLSSSSNGDKHMQPTTPQAAAAAAGQFQAGPNSGLIDPGVFVTGCYNKLQVVVQPGGSALQRFKALMAQPGLYQFAVADLVLQGATAGGSSSSSSVVKSGVDKNGYQKLYYNQDRFYVLVTG